MALLKTEEEIALIRESSLLVGKVLAEVAKWITPGVAPLKLDKIAHDFIKDHGALPGFLGFGGFPNSLCISVNDVVVHGIPTETPLENGDIISVDCGVLMNGFYGDSAYTFEVGDVKPEIKALIEVTKSSLYAGISQAVEGKRIGDIGAAVQEIAENAGFSVVRELVGHGLGSDLHEAPEVPNFGRRGKGKVLLEGMVLAIEPMINFGKRHITQSSDGWTIRTSDSMPSAHFEHDVVVRKGKAEILSSFEEIEAVLNNKKAAA